MRERASTPPRRSRLSPAGITSRIDKLERAGLVERALGPEDRRSFRVSLTRAGRRLADDGVTAHVANEQRLLSPLTERERAQLDRLLRKLTTGDGG